MNTNGKNTEKAAEKPAKSDDKATPKLELKASDSKAPEGGEGLTHPSQDGETGASAGGGVKLAGTSATEEFHRVFRGMTLYPPPIRGRDLRPASPNHLPISPARTPPPPCTAAPPGTIGNPELPRRPRKNTLQGPGSAIPPDLALLGFPAPPSSLAQAKATEPKSKATIPPITEEEDSTKAGTDGSADEKSDEDSEEEEEDDEEEEEDEDDEDDGDENSMSLEEMRETMQARFTRQRTVRFAGDEGQQ